MPALNRIVQEHVQGVKDRRETGNIRQTSNRGMSVLTVIPTTRRLPPMQQSLGDAIAAFDSALTRLREALSAHNAVEDAVFADTEDWTSLLTYKLAPHLAGEGCLIIAVAGGTNTGKSTVFNLLLGAQVSPVVSTAAATRHPLLAANASRTAQCLDKKLVPEFVPKPFNEASDVLAVDVPEETIFVTQAPGLSDRLAILDTPDVDSIERANWKVAENIRAAGDVLVAVLTAEKYKDERVVEFFRRAAASGRVVLPLMNKANPENDFEVARRQLDEFCADAGLETPCFVVQHDFNLAANGSQEIRALDGETALRPHLESLDVPAIKREVFRSTLVHFADRADAFLDQAHEVSRGLRAVVNDFETRTHDYSARYDPAPGAAIGGLFHEFVQSKRGAPRRVIGSVSTALYRGIGTVAGKLTRGFLNRAALDAEATAPTDEEIRAQHTKQIELITQELATSLIESSRSLREPAALLLEEPIRELDSEVMMRAVVDDTIRTENISDEFRDHAYAMLDTWWNDHRGKRRALEALDTMLAVMPTAIAAPMSFYTGGVGVAEMVAVAGPLAEQFVARVLEYQFGDAMFNFLAPWRKEQQAAYEEALRRHLVDPCLHHLREFLAPLDGDTMNELEGSLDACRNAL
jgi:50S ribosome-binding GTPase